MADKSKIKLDVEIKNLASFQKLSKITPKLVKDFQALGRAMDKINKSKIGRGGSSSSGGGASKIKKRTKDIRERISLFNLKISNEEINSIKQAQGAMGSMQRSINSVRRSLDRQGKSTRKLDILEQRLKKSFNRGTTAIKKRQQAQSKLNSLNAKSISIATQRQKQNLLSPFAGGRGGGGLARGGIRQRGRGSRRGNRDQFADINAQGAFLLTNLGFFIQDSPFGIRGVANNISGVTRGFNLLRNQVNETNKALGSNITVFSALKGLIKGPTGIFLLIGSVLPAALEFGQRAFKRWSRGSKKNVEALQSAIEKFADKLTELQGIGGETDLFGIAADKNKLKIFQDVLKDLQELEKLGNRRTKFSGTSFGTGAGAGIVIDQDVASQFNKLKKELQALSGLPIADVEKFTKDLRLRVAANEAIANRDPAIRLQRRQFSSIEDDISTVNALSEIEEDLPKISKGKLKESRENLEFAKKIFINTFAFFDANGQIARRNATAESIAIINNALGKKEDDGVPDVKQVAKSPEIDVPDRVLPSITGDIRQARIDRKIANIRSQSENVVGTIRGGAGRLLESNVRRRSRLQVESARISQRQDLESLRREEESKLADLIKNLDELSSKKKEIRAQLQQLRDEDAEFDTDRFDSRDEAIGFRQDQLDAAEKAFVRLARNREEILENSAKNKELIELKTANKIEQINRDSVENLKQIQFQRLDAQAELGNLIGQTFTNTFESIRSFADDNSKALFNISKALAVSQAVMNTRQAFTKALAQTGILSKPLAFGVLASGLSQAALIASRDLNSSVGNASGGGGGTGIFRGFGTFNDENFSTAFFGNSDRRTRENTRGIEFPDSFQTTFREGGSAEIITKGTTKILKDGRADLGFLQSPIN